MAGAVREPELSGAGSREHDFRLRSPGAHSVDHLVPDLTFLATAGLTSEGFSTVGTSAALAITLAAQGPSRPAEVIRTGAGRLATYAPTTPQQFEFSWGPHGLFRIETATGDNPGSLNTYIGAAQSDWLSAPITYGADGAAFNPAGTVIALQDSNQVTFLPTPSPPAKAPPACTSSSNT